MTDAPAQTGQRTDKNPTSSELSHKRPLESFVISMQVKLNKMGLAQRNSLTLDCFTVTRYLTITIKLTDHSIAKP